MEIESSQIGVYAVYQVGRNKIEHLYLLKTDGNIYGINIIPKYIGKIRFWQLEINTYTAATKKENQSVKDALLGVFPFENQFDYYQQNYKFRKINLIPGNYHPRIHKPIITLDTITVKLSPSDNSWKYEEELSFIYEDFYPFNEKLLVSSINQLLILKAMFNDIIINIYPSKENMNTYGYSIKNLLVLACIEVENHFQGILRANSIKNNTSHNTADFVKLKNIMHLDRYSVGIPTYPEIDLILPFANWSDENPTKSIKWFDSYNAIKHNGEQNFHKATLINAINAMCAVAILIKAQFGNQRDFWEEHFGNFFSIKNDYTWDLDEMVLPPIHEESWIPIYLDFKRI